MSYKTYDEYKESNIKWIDKIPSTWETIKAKHCFKLSGGYAFKSDDFIEEGIPLVRIGDITHGTIDFNNCKRLPLEYAILMKEFLVNSGDILIALTGATIGKIGQVPETNEKILLNQRVGRLSSNSSNYYKYILSSDLIKKQINLIAEGSAQENISNEDIGNFEIFDIDEKTKKQIANYLDKQTAKIDETISKNKQLIDLLEEKRVALINQVVTKGLNPEVPMKDSGIEWIGEIPEHWSIAPLSRYTNVTKLAGFEFTEHIEYIPDGEIIALRALNIKNNKLNLNNIVKIAQEVSDKLPRSKLYKDDLIFTYIGAKTGAVALIDKDNTYHLAPNIAKITNISKDKLNTKFLLYNITSHHEQEEIWFKIAKSGQEAISMEKIRTLSLVIPPLEEQNQIVNHLDKETSKINETIDKIKQNISLLEEYNTSLIHHVVTGKIDVRGEEL